ncbi:hypothetical protein, partial [Niveispirillum sp. KHB5.9]|uniref:hypothetical protein n=1 Tax=Niveispirillum sp. KHB5.9 TaxID=3400269 RepID=UPI003A86B1BB
MNRYAYVKNSPYMGVDPTGLQAVIPAPVPLPIPLPPIVDPTSKENKEWVEWGKENLPKALSFVVRALTRIPVSDHAVAAVAEGETVDQDGT